ncbi:MAG: ATP-binding protein, partial [Saprospiraceae bacterium]|nr:ATP-binding protein [Saprospiraceae bacterium]
MLDNALKFTPAHGKVGIQLLIAEKSVEIKISDTGPGIPKDLQSAIFERYRKADVNSEHDKGAGLGLAIVKKILEI